MTKEKPPEFRYLKVFLRSGSIMGVPLPKEEAIRIAEEWSDFQKDKYRDRIVMSPRKWISYPLSKLFYAQLRFLRWIGIIQLPKPIPFEGGVGWGFLFPDAIAVHAIDPWEKKPDIQERIVKVQERLADAMEQGMTDGED